MTKPQNMKKKCRDLDKSLSHDDYPQYPYCALRMMTSSKFLKFMFTPTHTNYCNIGKRKRNNQNTWVSLTVYRSNNVFFSSGERTSCAGTSTWSLIFTSNSASCTVEVIHQHCEFNLVMNINWALLVRHCQSRVCPWQVQSCQQNREKNFSSYISSNQWLHCTLN